MSRSVRVFLLSSATLVVAVVATACGTERIAVSQSSPVHSGAVLFSQRCSGCHTLSYAATHGSAPNIRTAQANSGPNLNLRCERPITRVLYAIENGGFSGAYMPQNIVVGHDAEEVARFVATYAGRGAPKLTGIPQCDTKPIGTYPSPSSPSSTSSTPTATIAASSTGTNTAVASAPAHQGAKGSRPGSAGAKGSKSGSAGAKRSKSGSAGAKKKKSAHS